MYQHGRGFVALLAIAVLSCYGHAGTLQWDFNGDLAPTISGEDLVAEAATPETTPTVDFVMETIDGVDAEVASFSRGTYFRMTHNFPANGGGSFVNQYTLIMDVLFPDTVTSGWAALWQTNTANSNDGDWFLKSGAGVGISGNYGGFVPDGEWHRLALVVDLLDGTFTSYVDGVQAMQNTGEGLDGRFSLDPQALIFADEDGENSAGLVNSVQFRDVALTADQISDIGGPTADGIPLPSDPRDCEFRSFSVAYDRATNAVSGVWSLLPGDEGFRVFEGARQVGGDLPATATSFTDSMPPANGEAVTYSLECIAGGKVDKTCVSGPIQTFECASGLACAADAGAVKASLTWRGAVNTTATGYEVVRNGQSLASLPPEASSYTDDTLPGPGIYVYRVALVGTAPASCSAPLTCSVGVLGDDLLLFDNFDSYATDQDLAAAGWEIHEVNSPSEIGAFWTLTNPGGRGNPPTEDGTPSAGNFIVSDSDASTGDDHQGSGMSHDIWSPSFDASGKASVWLHMSCSAMLNNNGEVVFDVDLTTDDGESWTNVFRRVAPGRSLEPLPTADIPEDMPGGPQIGNADAVYGPLDIDISDVAAGEPSVRFRLRQFEPSDDWWIAVDDVRVDATPVVGGPRALLETDFGDGIPGDWNVESRVDSLAPWSETDTCLISLLNFNGGTFPDGADGRRLHHFDTAFAMVALDELSCVAAPQDEWLETPAIDATETTRVWLHVKSDILVTNAVAEILLSTDGGETFDAQDPIFTYNADDESLVRDPGNAEAVYGDFVFSVPAAAGKSGIVFAFHYLNPTPDYGFWAIDDVKVTAEGGAERPLFHRGDPNDDGVMNITDGIYVLNFLFLGGPAPTCDESGDSNNDGAINITDGIYILNFLFLGGPQPPEPGPPGSACGSDPDAPGSAQDLGCKLYTKC